MLSRNISTLPPEALLRLPEVVALVGLRRASIYARAAQGTFPRPIKLTAHASGWRLGDIRVWLANPTNWKSSEGISVAIAERSAQGEAA